MVARLLKYNFFKRMSRPFEQHSITSSRIAFPVLLGNRHTIVRSHLAQFFCNRTSVVNENRTRGDFQKKLLNDAGSVGHVSSNIQHLYS
ncbi:hypothetical protein GDO86_005729 [Hymenochirus boettgeri]|uniref:Uncharacterized protein n=1 Tax=Hymenochirus boettgeri TaxID=247094 RepID=A0A8T2J7D4_9PIPI|nr:hypothetical protein GDO86_005729 [Hymenochirus boettgeri]